MIKTIEATPELELVCSVFIYFISHDLPFGNEDHLKVLFVVYFTIVHVDLVFIRKLLSYSYHITYI